jgi:hypothetical protein
MDKLFESREKEETTNTGVCKKTTGTKFRVCRIIAKKSESDQK